ncbi:Formylglycine-generating sulfatase enzyme [Botrimarina colliarenosi]|uniref:Formylglycine-generating sulfatase enzyme n=1 Tax=Botrimarina colliarenosi TaxID=2528001 RepID=A0A5C6AE87_9BACT|nr:SUMF1/EgtB/PvdO family nonheme iron enzyme [Botrimarina colliarenosi]TWT97919.1 Formylglycine-generating sulfatase enzyme [Botrimarina colliarenosi]
MIRTLILPLLLAAVAGVPAAAGTVSFDFATVGNAGNAADPQTGFGAVSYNYAISKHEVTNAQYTEFLNAVDPTGANSLALYNPSMSGNFGGIENTGATDGARYIAQAGREQNPVTFVSFFDAMRFTNWLHNGQGSGGTETGAYAIGSGVDEVRSADAKFWVPSEDEWYKAAYHDASAGTAGVYFDYATGSDSVPVSDQPGDDPGAVNYFNNDGAANGFNDGYAVSGSTSFPSSTNRFTDVGAYTGAASPYGTFDQNGNVWEWNEAVISSSFRGLRGGSWYNSSSGLRAADRVSGNPTLEFGIVGFRVATVPEPSSLLIGALAAVGLLLRRRV